MVKTIYANFNDRGIQLVPESCDDGCIATIKDPSKLADKATVGLQWRDLPTIVGLLSDTKKQALVKLLGLDTATLVKLVQDNSTDDVSLADIPIGTVEEQQRNRIRNALQLVNDAPVIKGFLADDRQKIIYWNGNLYGVKRLMYSDVTSVNQRSGYEGSNEARPINGTGNANFDNASNQWYTIFFAARNVFSVKLRHTNNNWANRRLQINYTAKNLTASSGSYTYTYLPVNGWQSLTRLQFVDDGGNTSLDDLQVLYSSADTPTLINGQTLVAGDFFKVENTNQILRFEGVDPASGAWKAVPVSNNLQVDLVLDPISTNAIQNRAVYAALEQLRITLGDRIDAIGIVDELQGWIEKQLLLNALVINRLDDIYEKLERK